MRCMLLLSSILTFMGFVAFGQTGDLGAQIAAEDAQLGASPGEIHVTASGTISEGKVSLSTGHDLICNKGVTISLNAGSYLYQNSHTRIVNCIIAATSTPIDGEIQSVNTDHLTLANVTFVGGGNLVYWSGVTNFHISDNNIMSITAVDTQNQAPEGGYFLLNCSQGVVDNLTSNGFVFPAGLRYTGILQLNLCDHITINNPTVQGVDASYIHAGAAVVEINGSKNIIINGGNITHNANMDGILSEGYPTQTAPTIPSSYLTIDGLNSSYNGASGLNQEAPLALGDGLDIINTNHVVVSHCSLNGNGNPHDQQPGIWFFIDDDVEVNDSDISENSAAGIAAAGTPNVQLIRDTINRNSASGVYTEWQAGLVTNVGSAVSFVSGVSGGFGLDWLPGTPVILDGVTYQIATVTDSGHLTLMTSPPDHSSPVSLGVNTTQYITDTVINDNGVGKWAAKFGSQNQVGISWADGTSGVISGVTSINTGVGQQLYGLELANTASVTLYNDDFSGNLLGGDGIDASQQGLSTNSLSFANQTVATSSAAQIIDFWAGMIVAPNLVIQTSGNFSQTNNCGSMLAAYVTCQIRVAFTPTSVGDLKGTLTITDTAPGSPKTIYLNGTGVDSLQGASSDSLSFPNQQVGTTSATQTVTFWAGAKPVQNLVIQTSGSFSQTNSCGTSLTAPATCQIQVTFTPTVLGTVHGTLTIKDSSPNPQTISLTGTAIAQGIGLSIATGGSSSAMVKAGGTAKYVLSIGGSGIGGTASLTCTGTPSRATCSLPATEPVKATQSATFAVSVVTTTVGKVRPGDSGNRSWPWAVFGLAILPTVKSRQPNRRRWVCFSAFLLLLCSCGGGTKVMQQRGSSGTPVGQYTLILTATVGTTSQQIPLTLTVQ